MLGVEMRRARDEDAQVVAEIWTLGWRDGHLGNVPDAMAEVRTPETFRDRAAQRVADTTVAVVGDEIAGFVMVVGDEVEQVYVGEAHRGSGFDLEAAHAGGVIPVPCRRYTKRVKTA